MYVCMYVCMCLCMCLCMYVSMYTYACTHTHNTYLYIYMYYIHTYIHTYIHACIHTYIHKYTYIYIHIHTYTYVYIHTPTYTYIYIYIHTYIHTSIHIHTQLRCTHVDCDRFSLARVYLAGDRPNADTTLGFRRRLGPTGDRGEGPGSLGRILGSGQWHCKTSGRVLIVSPARRALAFLAMCEICHVLSAGARGVTPVLPPGGQWGLRERNTPEDSARHNAWKHPGSRWPRALGPRSGSVARPGRLVLWTRLPVRDFEEQPKAGASQRLRSACANYACRETAPKLAT